MSGKTINIRYIPEPTPKRFHESDREIRFLAGSLGQGKTLAAAIFEPLSRGINQEPHPKTKLRETRWIVTRATFGEIESAIVDELEHWFPEEIFRVSRGRTITAHFKFPHPSEDGSTVKTQIRMIGMNRPDSYSKVRSTNVTGICMNEADTQNRKVFTYASQRGYRFPAPDERAGFKGATWGGIVGDYNPPSIRHWLHKDLVVKPMFDRHGNQISEIFHMEPPLYRVRGEKMGGFYCGGYTYFENPKAEGVKYQTKGFDYWYGEISKNHHDDNYIRRFILGEYVPTYDGTPVFPEFDAEEHVSPKELKPIDGKPILLCFDWGRSAACTISQTDDLGRILFLDEIYDGDIVLSKFLKEKLRPLLQSKYRNFRIRALGDPSGGKSGMSDITPFMEVNNFFEASKIDAKCVKARTNEWQPRREATVYCLSRKDGLLFSPHMDLTIDAMAGNYLYKSSTIDGIEKEEPLKNEASHLADTVQMHCLDFKFFGTEGADSSNYNTRYYERHAARRRAR